MQKATAQRNIQDAEALLKVVHGLERGTPVSLHELAQLAAFAQRVGDLTQYQRAREKISQMVLSERSGLGIASLTAGL